MKLNPKALFWLIKLITRSAQRIAPNFSLNFSSALKLKTVSEAVCLSNALHFWGAPKAFSRCSKILIFSNFSFDFTSLTRPIANLFFPAKPEFATENETPVLAPEVQTSEEILSDSFDTAIAEVSSVPGLPLARFFAAGPEKAHKVVLLQETLRNLESDPEMGATTSIQNHSNVETRKANPVSLGNALTVVEQVAKTSCDPPEIRKTTAPTKKTKKTKGKTQRKTCKSVKAGLPKVVAEIEKEIPVASPGLDVSKILDNTPRFVTFKNPFQALEGLDDDEFHGFCRRGQHKNNTETSASVEAPVPTLKPVATPLGTAISSTLLTPPLSPVFANVNLGPTVDNHDSPKVNKRRKKRNNVAKSPSPLLKKPLPVIPFKDTPESWRQAASPPRSPSPITRNPTAQNKWRPAHKRKRRNYSKHDMDAQSVTNLNSNPTLNLSPKMTPNEGSEECTYSMIKRTFPSVVILRKTKKDMVPSKA